MLRKELLLIIKGIKKIIIFILEILIKIGNVWERTVINIKGIKKTVILHLENTDKNRGC